MISKLPEQSLKYIYEANSFPVQSISIIYSMIPSLVFSSDNCNFFLLMNTTTIIVGNEISSRITGREVGPVFRKRRHPTARLIVTENNG